MLQTKARSEASTSPATAATKTPASMLLVVEAEAEHAILVEELHERLSTTHVYGCRCEECLHVRRQWEEVRKPLNIDACPEEFLAAHIRFHLNRRKNRQEVK